MSAMDNCTQEEADAVVTLAASSFSLPAILKTIDATRTVLRAIDAGEVTKERLLMELGRRAYLKHLATDDTGDEG